MARTDIPLGIVPAGTGNDHAREYRLPTTADPVAAVDIIAAGRTETVDLGLIRGPAVSGNVVRHRRGNEFSTRW